MKTLFITGAAGYVGAMLADQFSLRPDVAKIICLDKEPMPDFLKGREKIVWITANTSDDTWEESVRAYAPDTVIHTAWQIREMYGDQKTQWKWNIVGSEKIFDFAFSLPSVKTLIHFSTVASYAAYPENTLEHRFTEDEPFRKSDYRYAEEKRIVEERLKEKYAAALKRGGALSDVFVVRPVSITGPYGRHVRVRFGLQSVLSGQAKGSLIHRMISALVSFVPITKKWARQFVHEDDINDIVALLAFRIPDTGRFEIFNACPPGDSIVSGRDMATAVHKRAVLIPPWLIRTVFFLTWHLSCGRIPTSRGGWKSYSYPIIVDGSKITKLFGYHYQYESRDAFVKTTGRYEKYIKVDERL